jgi:serine/threonine protein kinase
MKSIGKYEVFDEIGASVTGTTYRARDAFRKRDLALKVLHPLPTLDADAKDEFCRELSRCSELTHRHLAKVLDLGEAEGQVYIATELLSGADLRGLSAGNRELTIAQKIGILAQACEGLAFAHSREIAHGAIKPSNIFVNGNNDVTILDLGTAKWQSLMLAAGSRPDGLLPNYFAPEQILGQSFDARSDLFSLALVAYEFLAGRYPFQVPASLIPREIVHSEPESLRMLNPDIPEELEQLLIRGLKKKPEERLQTAEEFAAGFYGIAQHLRRLPPAPTPVQAPDPATLETPASIQETPASIKTAESESKTPKRQDVQTATQEQPWTARSYVAGPVNRSEDKAAAQPAPPHAAPPQPAAPQQEPFQQEPAATAKTANSASPGRPRTVDEAKISPKNAPINPGSVPTPAPSMASSRIRRKPAAAKPLKRRVVAVALGAVLAIYAIVNYVSHQGLHASQNQSESPKPVVHEKTAIPEVNRSSERAAAAAENTPAPVADPPAVAEPPKPEPKPEQILRKQVKGFWESGNYSEAMRLVDQVLTTSPANREAQAWKKRIRAAQEAEADIK